MSRDKELAYLNQIESLLLVGVALNKELDALQKQNKSLQDFILKHFGQISFKGEEDGSVERVVDI